MEEFPEYPLWGRYKRAFDWTPGGVQRILDAGCAWGYGTRYFTAKAREVHGLDPNAPAIEVARERHPEITFVHSALEATPFEAEWFDAIVSCDVLEHVDSDLACVSELHRILKPGGVAVLTMPHDGPLGFMDPDNWAVSAVIRARERFPRLYARYKRTISPGEGGGGEAGKVPDSEAEHAEHRHYSISDLRALLDRSAFGGDYEIDRVYRSGFVIEMLVVNVHYVLKRILRGRAKEAVEWAFGKLLVLDWAIPTGRLANNLAVRIVKRG